MCKIIDPDPSGLFQSPSNSIRRLHLESSIRGQLDAPADVRVPPGLRFGAHERAHDRAYEQAHGRARERGPVRAAETMAEPRPPNRPWSPRRSPRRSRRAGPLGVRASELWRLQLTSTTHTPVHGVLSRARARLCLTRRGIGPILVRVFKCKLILPGGTWEQWAPSPPSTTIRKW